MPTTTGATVHTHRKVLAQKFDPRLVEVAHGFAWTQGVITAAGWLNWLTALPLELRLELRDGTRLLAVHVAPGQDDGQASTLRCRTLNSPHFWARHRLIWCVLGILIGRSTALSASSGRSTQAA
jgi:hypothetical protein